MSEVLIFFYRCEDYTVVFRAKPTLNSPRKKSIALIDFECHIVFLLSSCCEVSQAAVLFVLRQISIMLIIWLLNIVPLRRMRPTAI